MKHWQLKTYRPFLDKIDDSQKAQIVLADKDNMVFTTPCCCWMESAGAAPITKDGQ